MSCRSDFTPLKFKAECLICGDTYLIEADPKNRKRWRRVVQCATADRGLNLDLFRKVMLDACDVRDDEWGGHQVRITKSVCYYSAALETSNILVH